MTKLLTSAALLALLATPALAQAYNPGYGTGNDMASPPASYLPQNNGVAAAPSGRNAFASAPRDQRGVHARAQAWEPEVYAYGRDVGTDPDANIRFQLERDPPGLD